MDFVAKSRTQNKQRNCRGNNMCYKTLLKKVSEEIPCFFRSIFWNLYYFLTKVLDKEVRNQLFDNRMLWVLRMSSVTSIDWFYKSLRIPKIKFIRTHQYRNNNITVLIFQSYSNRGGLRLPFRLVKKSGDGKLRRLNFRCFN